jgi:hypothetical protein
MPGEKGGEEQITTTQKSAKPLRTNNYTVFTVLKENKNPLSARW